MSTQLNPETSQNQLSPLEEKIRILRLKKTQHYYAKKLKRSKAAITQALSEPTINAGLLARIARHSDYLEKQQAKKKQQSIKD